MPLFPLFSARPTVDCGKVILLLNLIDENKPKVREGPNSALNILRGFCDNKSEHPFSKSDQFVYKLLEDNVISLLEVDKEVKAMTEEQLYIAGTPCQRYVSQINVVQETPAFKILPGFKRHRHLTPYEIFPTDIDWMYSTDLEFCKNNISVKTRLKISKNLTHMILEHEDKSSNINIPLYEEALCEFLKDINICAIETAKKLEATAFTNYCFRKAHTLKMFSDKLSEGEAVEKTALSYSLASNIPDRKLLSDFSISLLSEIATSTLCRASEYISKTVLTKNNSPSDSIEEDSLTTSIKCYFEKHETELEETCVKVWKKIMKEVKGEVWSKLSDGEKNKMCLNKSISVCLDTSLLFNICNFDILSSELKENLLNMIGETSPLFVENSCPKGQELKFIKTFSSNIIYDLCSKKTPYAASSSQSLTDEELGDILG